MLTLLLVIRRLVETLRAALADATFRVVGVSIVTLLATATIFYSVKEGWSILDSLYFSVITGLTIGYGDLVPTDPVSKVFTIFYALLAVGLFVTLATSLAKASLARAAKHRHDRPPPDDAEEKPEP